MPRVKGNVETNVPEEQKSMKKYTIGTGASAADIVSWDREGAVLQFELQEGFVPLDDGIVSQLSRENKLRYEIAKEFHDSWRGRDHEKFVEQFQVDKNLMGSATDKLNVKDSKTLHFRWARPDRVDSYLQQGYRVASPDEVKTYLGPNGNKHEISILGKQDLLLLCTPKSEYEKRQKAKVERNKKDAGLVAERGLGDLKSATGTAFIPPDKDDKSWTEITEQED